jgi:trehalose utilization protein
VFYFRPGHETYPTYHDQNVMRVIRNAVHWAYNPALRILNPNDAPNRPVQDALEPLVERGAKLHQDGQEGLS